MTVGGRHYCKQHGKAEKEKGHAPILFTGPINSKRAPWSSNPFVWVVTFKRSKP